jgi:glycopeptide antibiotics resistance protein
MAITIPNPASIDVHVSHDSNTNSKSHTSNSNSQTFAFPFSKISKFQAFASDIMNLTSFPNFGQIALPFGLQICLAKVFQSTTRTSFTFNSSLIISTL